MRYPRRVIVFVNILPLALLVSVPLRGAETDKWDVNTPHGPTDLVEFETSEGTWMSLDVSPDGKTIVFDLLGDIYTIPFSGGTATLISEGPAFEAHPRFSPDGKKIAFTSDRNGCDNIWIMDADGKNPHAVINEKERQTSNPVWTPDGNYIIARKHYRNTRSLGAGEMWMYHRSGGDGLQLTKRRNWQQNAADPFLSPDGRYLYYDEDVSPGNQFEYNRDPYGVIYVIQRLDRVSGKSRTIASGNGGSVRPVISPDGKLMAFVRRVRLNSVLFLKNLETDEEWPLYDKLSQDAQEAWAIFGLYPSFAWTPDGKEIVIWAQGGIKRINAETGLAKEIPFNARVKQSVAQALRFRQDVAPDSLNVRMLRWVTTSPDGGSVVYSALGYLWIRSLPSGTPKRLTSDSHFEFYPAFSPDGRWVVYAAWDDTDKGAVYKVRSTGGKGIKITATKGTYIEPSVSPDGGKVAFVKLGGDMLRGQSYGTNPGVYWVPFDGGTEELITEEGSSPRFNKHGDRIFLSSSEGEKLALISVNLLGGDRRVHLTSDNAQQIVPSPDEQWVAFTERYNSYVAPLALTGQPVQIGPSTSDLPVRRLTRDAGMYLHWSRDSRTVFWSLGPELFSRPLTSTFTFVPGAPDSLSDKPDSTGIKIGFMTPSEKPMGSLALTGATVITMKGDEVIQNATILVENNRIRSVGPASQVPVPAGAKKIDVRGAYVMPGMIDVHAHGPAGSYGITPQQNWAFYANLAYGVTTEHDPSNDTEEVFASAELIRSGNSVGPRLFSTGTILYGAEGSYKAVINTLDDARSHLRRLKSVGAFSVKSYNQPRRDQRQQVIQAARELQMMVVPEGGSTLNWNITQILDGHTGIEHSLPVAPLYKDVITLFSRSQTGYTPTLVVAYGGLMGETYWYMHINVWENRKLLNFVPRSIVDARSRRRTMAEDGDWHHIEIAKGVKAHVDAGGRAQLGAHGQLQGLGAHWELWSLVQGGMTPMQAIRCATLNGAWYLGLDSDLGSIEPGKLADLIVLDRNPLDDIRNSESIRYVMANGHLYDASTMHELGNTEKKRLPFFWEGGRDPGTYSQQSGAEED
jgi:Tol biopolymer transport system component/imidazolonepropionase-like amidohydrolase